MAEPAFLSDSLQQNRREIARDSRMDKLLRDEWTAEWISSCKINQEAEDDSNSDHEPGD
jgi:exonuclease III